MKKVVVLCSLLVLLSGCGSQKIPFVLGVPEAQAMELLKEYDVRVTYAYNDLLPEGTIVSISEQTGGSTPTLDVVVGLQGTKIPDTHGALKDDALKILLDAGFQVKVEEVFSGSVAQGVVVQSQPERNEVVETGSEVVLQVSKGPQLVMPVSETYTYESDIDEFDTAIYNVASYVYGDELVVRLELFGGCYGFDVGPVRCAKIQDAKQPVTVVFNEDASSEIQVGYAYEHTMVADVVSTTFHLLIPLHGMDVSQLQSISAVIELMVDGQTKTITFNDTFVW